VFVWVWMGSRFGTSITFGVLQLQTGWRQCILEKKARTYCFLHKYTDRALHQSVPGLPVCVMWIMNGSFLFHSLCSSSEIKR
jgi:hypothetical protein